MMGRLEHGIRRAHFHPFRQIGDLLVGKLFALWRHLQIGIGVANGFDEQTAFRVARDDGGPGIASLGDAVAIFEGKVAAQFFRLRTVAFVTVVNKNRADFGFKELELSGGWGRAGRKSRESAQSRKKGKRREIVNLRVCCPRFSVSHFFLANTE